MTDIVNAETFGGTNTGVQITGLPANMTKVHGIFYGKKTGSGGSNLGYVFANNTATASEGGWRMLLQQDAGGAGSRPVVGISSSGTANQPAVSGTYPTVSDGGGKTTDNVWQYTSFFAKRQTTKTDFKLKVNGVNCVEDSGASQDGSGSNVDDTARTWWIGNRNGTSGGRQLQAEMGYLGFYDELSDAQEAAVRANGPLTTEAGVFDRCYFVYANGQIYQGGLGGSIAIGTRTTRVTSAAPPNVALGDVTTTPVSNDLDAAYSVIGRVSKDLDAAFNIFNPVQKDLDGSYSILSATAVSSDLDASYNVIGRVSADLDAAFSVIGRVTADLDGSYAIVEATPYLETQPFKRNNGTLHAGLTGLTVGLLKMSDFSFAGAFPGMSTNAVTARLRVEDMDLERGEEYALVTKNAAGVLGVEKYEAL